MRACGRGGKLAKGEGRNGAFHQADHNVHAEADGSPARVLFRPAGRNIACAQSRGRVAGGLGHGVRKP